MNEWMNEWMNDWLIDWLIDWMIDWLKRLYALVYLLIGDNLRLFLNAIRLMFRNIGSMFVHGGRGVVCITSLTYAKSASIPLFTNAFIVVSKEWQSKKTDQKWKWENHWVCDVNVKQIRVWIDERTRERIKMNKENENESEWKWVNEKLPGIFVEQRILLMKFVPLRRNDSSLGCAFKNVHTALIGIISHNLKESSDYMWIWNKAYVL
jgi:hypothetical protein